MLIFCSCPLLYYSVERARWLLDFCLAQFRLITGDICCSTACAHYCIIVWGARRCLASVAHYTVPHCSGNLLHFQLKLSIYESMNQIWHAIGSLSSAGARQISSRPVRNIDFDRSRAACYRLSFRRVAGSRTPSCVVRMPFANASNNPHEITQAEAAWRSLDIFQISSQSDEPFRNGSRRTEPDTGLIFDRHGNHHLLTTGTGTGRTGIGHYRYRYRTGEKKRYRHTPTY